MISTRELALVCLTILLLFGMLVGGCHYSNNILPQKMAERDLCWGPTDLQNATPYYGWRHCVKPK